MDKEHQADHFLVSLGQSDWDKDLKGWRCDVLRLASMALVAVFVQGEKQSDDHYIVNNDVIRWRTTPSPPTLKIQVRLSSTTSGAPASAELQARLEKLQEEHDAKVLKASEESKKQQDEIAKLKLEHTALELEKKFSLRHLITASLFTLLATIVPLAFAFADKTTKPTQSPSASAGAAQEPKCPPPRPCVATNIDAAKALTCRSSYLRLKTASREAALTCEDLRARIGQHLSDCETTLRDLVDSPSDEATPQAGATDAGSPQ